MMKNLWRILAFVALATILMAQTVSYTPYGPTVAGKAIYSSASASISTTTLWTPTEDGLYTIVFYGAPTATGGNSSMNGTIYWTDLLQAETQGVNVGPGGQAVPTSQVFSVYVKSGYPIQYAATYSPGTSYLTYDIAISVIKD
jgi:hypothetical protein